MNRAPRRPAATGHLSPLIMGARTAQEIQRDRIKAALLDNPELSHNAIAKRLGLPKGSRAVDRACVDLVANSSMTNCGHRLTESGKQAPGPKPTAPPARKPQHPPGPGSTSVPSVPTSNARPP